MCVFANESYTFSYFTDRNILLVSSSDISLNDLVAVKSSEAQVYNRARVSRVAEDNETVTVTFLDSGSEDSVVNLMSLYQLPASLNEDKFPAEAMRARLVGLRPPHNDPDWSELSTKIVAGHLCPPESLRSVSGPMYDGWLCLLFSYDPGSGTGRR